MSQAFQSLGGASRKMDDGVKQLGERR